MPRQQISTGPSIYRRGDGRWMAKVQVDGVRKNVYGSTPNDVRKKVLDLQRQIIVDGGLPAAGNRTLNNLLDTWLQWAGPTLKPRTLQVYQDTLTRYVRPTLGRQRLSAVTPDKLQRLYATLQRRGLTRTPAQVHTTLHRALKLAVVWGWLTSNPADRVLPPKYHAKAKDVWDRDEARRFIVETREDQLHPLFVLLISTGCRLGEATGLRWSDVDWDLGTIRIRRNVQRIRGEFEVTNPKTTAGERTVAVPMVALDALRKHQARQETERLTAAQIWQDGAWIFTARNGAPLNPSVAQHAVRRMAERPGLPKVTPHLLRHLHASILIDDGVPITAVAARLGHANPGVTQSIYAHRLRGTDTRAADAIDRLFGETRTEDAVIGE